MLKYEEVKSNAKRFLALTGLTVREFEAILPAFERVYERTYPANKTVEGKPRKRKAGGGRSSELESNEQKLLLVLVYQKTYPLQELLGAAFDLSQPQVNHWLHRLLPVLRDALDEMDVLPERTGKKFSQHEKAKGSSKELIIDGVDRRRQRPKNKEKQKLHYSGKKKVHSDKNIVIVNAKTKRIGYLSTTYAGKVHDKKIAEQESISYPRNTTLYKDTGFQGYEPSKVKTLQPKKKPRKGVLTKSEKRRNRRISTVRVGVEHALSGAKRSRIIKDVLRNTKDQFSDLVMLIACGLHNLRVRYRKNPLVLTAIANSK